MMEEKVFSVIKRPITSPLKLSAFTTVFPLRQNNLKQCYCLLL